MWPATDRFDVLLQELIAARLADDEIHRRASSIEQRSASHDVLTTLRAEIASLRAVRGEEPMRTVGLHDLRTRLGG